jgi:ATP-binding cassette, subfamily B, bacterial
MLSGLYRLSAGRILVDDTDLAQLSPEEWRARTTVAFQDPVHIEMSLKDTVGLSQEEWLFQQYAELYRLQARYFV